MPVAVALATCVAYLRNNRPIELAIPTPAMPSPNALDDFVCAGRLARAMQHKSPYSMPGPPAQTATPANFVACAGDAGPMLAALRSGLGKEFRRPPVRSYYLGPNIGQYASCREIAREVAGAAEGFRLMRRPREAADTLLDGEELAVTIPRGGQILDDLTAFACEDICLRPFEPLVPALSRSELAHVAARLDRIAARRVPFADIVMEEGWSDAASMADELRRDRTPRRLWDAAWSLAPGPDQGLAAAGRAREAGYFVLADKTAMLRQNLAYYGALAEECRRPYAGKSRVPVPSNFLARVTLSPMDQARQIHLAWEAVVTVLRTEVALRRYRADHGRYPDRLDALAPTYLKSVPDDPFGGRAGVPLRYRLRGNGTFLLYSVGADMRDDGGLPAAYPPRKPHDIVAGKLFPSRSRP